MAQSLLLLFLTLCVHILLNNVSCFFLLRSKRASSFVLYYDLVFAKAQEYFKQVIQ